MVQLDVINRYCDVHYLLNGYTFSCNFCYHEGTPVVVAYHSKVRLEEFHLISSINSYLNNPLFCLRSSFFSAFVTGVPNL